MAASFDSLTLDQVEEEIRRAEELLTRDDKLDGGGGGGGGGGRGFVKIGEAERSNNAAEKVTLSLSALAYGEDAESVSDAATDADSSVAPSNVYKSPGARERLIQRLLAERKKRLEEEQRCEAREARLAKEEAERKATYGTSPRKVASPPRHPAKSKSPPSPPTASKTRLVAATPPRSLVANRSAAKKEGRASAVQPVPKSTCARGKPFSRRTREELKRDVELERQRQCTFRPKINKNYASKKRQGGGGDGFSRLSQPRTKYWQEIETKRKEKEDKLKQVCTFAPDLSRTEKAIVEEIEREASLSPKKKKKRKPGWKASVAEAYRKHVPVEKRLTLNAGQRYAVRERAKREIEDAELRKHTFRPTTNAVSNEIVKLSGSHRKPIFERAKDVQRQKAKRLHEKRAEIERSDPNLTFKPKISSVSKTIAKQVYREQGIRESGDIVERLSREARILEDRKNRQRKAWAEHETKACRFKPKVSATSKKILESHPEFQGKNQDFLKRQADMQRRKRERGAQKAKRRNKNGGEDPHCTFKPAIGNAEKVLVHTRPERLAETNEERYERLYKDDMKRKERLRESIRKEHYDQYDFKPKINRISKMLGCSTGGFEELYKNRSGKRAKEAVIKAVEDQRASECTFNPRTNEYPAVGYKPVNHLDSTTVMDNIDSMIRDKEEKLEQMRREREHNALKECTFQPAILAAAPKSTAPVIVRGLGRYLELKEMAKSQEEERIERERDAFRVKNIHRVGGCTVPRPFSFSLHEKANGKCF